MTTTTTPHSQARPELDAVRKGRHDAPPHWRGRLRAAVRATGLSLLMLALGYGGGWLHARTELSNMHARLQSADNEHQRSVTELRKVAELTRDQRDQLAELAVLYEGLRGTWHALDALDARNFGIAENSVRTAQQALATVHTPVGGLDALRQELASTNVAVAGNLEQQRRELAGLVRRLDGLVARERVFLVDLLPDGNVGRDRVAPIPVLNN